jgi:hypothetical protein
MMNFINHNITNVLNTINNLRELGIEGIIATLTIKKIAELILMAVLFIIPIPGTLEIYLVTRTAYKKYKANKTNIEVA